MVSFDSKDGASASGVPNLGGAFSAAGNLGGAFSAAGNLGGAFSAAGNLGGSASIGGGLGASGNLSARGGIGGSAGLNGAGSNGNAGGTYTIPDALLVAKFWVQIDGVAQAYFRECSGLQAQTDVFEYSEGGLNSYTHKLPVRTKVGNVTLKWGIVHPDVLWDWYSAVINGNMTRKPVTILLYENKVSAPSNQVTSWTLQDALPIKWVGPGFNVTANDVAISQMEFVCEGITRQ